MKRTGVFEVDTEGMRKIALRRGAAHLVFELIQNAWDEAGVTQVGVTLEPIPNRAARWRLVVEDDAPNGFANLADAWTLYGDSYKRSDPERRGFMDIGEKFVIAVCERAEILTTKGHVVFDDQGKRQNLRERRPAGTRFEGLLRITKVQGEEALAELRTLIPPDGIATTINGTPLLAREPLATVQDTLQTTVPNDEGVMERRMRKTSVRIYKPLNGEVPTLYEMGLPVVETGDQFHVNVMQRVPLNSERDNVPPHFLRAIRVLVLEATARELDREHAADTWVREAVGDQRTSSEVIHQVLDVRFGRKRVSYDPSDPEANSLAVAAGYTVVQGGSLSRDEWQQVRRAEAIKPAGQVTPSPRIDYSSNPDAPQERLVPPDKWTPGMHRIAAMSRWLARELLRVDISVLMVNEPIARAHASAWYGGHQLAFNVGRLGYRWFDRAPTNATVLALVLHELAHEIESNHLSDKYTDAVCDLAGRAIALALAGSFGPAEVTL